MATCAVQKWYASSVINRASESRAEGSIISYYDESHAAEFEQPVLWYNVFGEPVDLDSIDREYALNIYTMVVMRRARAAYIEGLTSQERDEVLRRDPLLQKLREVILKDAEKRPEDRRRAKLYNVRARRMGVRFRAATR